MVKKTEMQEVADTEQSEKIELTKEELDALIDKKVSAERHRIAMEEAKSKAKQALEEEAEKAKNASLSDTNTRKILNAEKKYKVTVFPADGENNLVWGKININGVVYKFKYGEPTTLPESCLAVLKNSKTFAMPELVKDRDGAHYQPKKVQKRAFNSEAL